MRALIIGLAILFVFTCVRDAQALDFHPDLIERCPRLSNPIECRGDDDERREDRDEASQRGDEDPSDRYIREIEAGSKTLQRKEDKRCERYRTFYLARHPSGPPDSLRLEHGCERWREDYDFHAGRTMGSEGFADSIDAIIGDLRLTLGLVR